MGLKKVLLKQGWAGKTISRTETASRLHPHIRTMATLLHAYNHLLKSTADHNVEFEAHLKTLRADIGKVNETIVSAGASTDRSPDLDRAHTLTTWTHLVDAEQSLLNSLKQENNVEHQMRTRAILQNVLEHAASRLDTARRFA